MRRVRVLDGMRAGSAEIALGGTVVRVSVEGEVINTTHDRPNDGKISLALDVSGTDVVNSDLSNAPLPVVAICNYVERLIRGSGAFDVEGLCILGGKTAWSLKCMLRVHSFDGNLMDACALATFCGFSSYKNFLVTRQNGEIVVCEHVSEGPPFSMKNIPISVTFGIGLLDGGWRYLTDASHEEENALGSSLTVAVTQYNDICSVYKAGGVPVTITSLLDCVKLAVARSSVISSAISLGSDVLSRSDVVA